MLGTKRAMGLPYTASKGGRSASPFSFLDSSGLADTKALIKNLAIKRSGEIPQGETFDLGLAEKDKVQPKEQTQAKKTLEALLHVILFIVEKEEAMMILQPQQVTCPS
jgi:hypothetical protein